MDFTDSSLPRKIAHDYCVVNVFDWDSLDDKIKCWYIETTIRLFIENKEVLRRFFNIQMN